MYIVVGLMRSQNAPKYKFEDVELLTIVNTYSFRRSDISTHCRVIVFGFA
jgi:hypothetical protein